MKTVTGILWIFLLIIGGFGCAEDKSPDIHGLEFRLVAVNEDGQEKNWFDIGESIGLRVKAINRSKKEFVTATRLACWFYQFDHFMEVYECLGSEMGDRKGIAYYNEANCLQHGLPDNVPAKSEASIISHYWRENPDNEPLPQGNYCSAINGEGMIDGVPVKVNLKVDFEVR